MADSEKMTWYPIHDDQIPRAEEIRRIKVSGKSICLVRHEGELFATSVSCPHAGADLSAGWCEEGRLICPYHRHAFNLHTGKGDPGQGNYIHTYPLERRDGTWFIGLKPGLLKKLFGK